MVRNGLLPCGPSVGKLVHDLAPLPLFVGGNYGMLHADDLDYGHLLREMGTEIDLPKGAVMRRDRVYFLESGYCALLALTDTGESYSFLYFRPGMLLNFMPAVAHTVKLHEVTRRRVSVLNQHVIMTRTPCRLLAVGAKDFACKVANSLPHQRLLTQALVENWINLLSLSLDITSRPAAVRVCRLLLDNTPDEPASRIPGFLTYPEIAAHLSLHCITVTKIFSALRHEGLLQKEGRAHLLMDRERLARMAGEEEDLVY